MRRVAVGDNHWKVSQKEQEDGGKKEERFEREGTSALCALFFIKPVDALSPAQNCQRTAFFPFLPPIPNPLFACGQRVEIKTSNIVAKAK